jgi:hypothetical protein
MSGDPEQSLRIAELSRDLRKLETFASDALLSEFRPFDLIYRFAEANLSAEGQEYCVTLIIEVNGDLVDDLAEEMAVEEGESFRIDGTMRCADLLRMIRVGYGWALRFDFSQPAAQARFWYASEEKLEPRLGERFEEPGMEREQPLAVARDIAAMVRALLQERPDARLAAFLLDHPEHRHTARRIQIAASRAYSEIRDNLIDASMRPIDILRFKLAFFGAMRFDPRSDRWVRITLFQGSPFPDELDSGDWDLWPFAA